MYPSQFQGLMVTICSVSDPCIAFGALMKVVFDGIKDYYNPHDTDNTYSWQDAQDTFIVQVNALNFGGYSDWRLPTIKELFSIVDLKNYSISIDMDFFPNIMLSTENIYWSSSSDSTSSLALFVGFGDGHVGHRSKGNSAYVRCVRGGQTNNSFVDNEDGTVTDTSTGMMWQQATTSEGLGWEEALCHCDALSLAEFSDWRLPNWKELQSIVSYETDDPAINTTYFPNTFVSGYWSSTTYLPGHMPSSLAQTISFSGGSDSWAGKYSDNYVRCVRAGLVFPTVTTGTASSSVTPQSVILNGTVNPNGNSTTAVFEWGTNVNYGNEATATPSPLTGTTTQSVSATLSGLTPGTAYHFRVIATNSIGVGYGLDHVTPTITITTTAISSITQTSATSGGNVTSSGGVPITAKGVCWGTSLNPTISNSKTVNGTGTGEFTSSVSGLSFKTTYHVRAYATNSQGTAYGSDLTFTSLPRPQCPECSNTPVVLTGVTFGSDTNCECSDATSIIIGPGVTIETGANIIFKAPTVNVKPGFRAKPGSSVQIKQGP